MHNKYQLMTDKELQNVDAMILSEKEFRLWQKEIWHRHDHDVEIVYEEDNDDSR